MLFLGLSSSINAKVSIQPSAVSRQPSAIRVASPLALDHAT
ncbi:hypothetical protein [Moorena sp. SIOASIH]|nr:hypothetical protein [Moorena sp. SIOASIH]